MMATAEKAAVSAANSRRALAVAKAKGVEVESDDNKADLIRKIEQARK